MSQAKANILARLKKATGQGKQGRQTHGNSMLTKYTSENTLSQMEAIQTLTTKLSENHIKVHIVDQQNWQHTLCEIAKEKGATHWLLGNGLNYQKEAREALSQHHKKAKITQYDQPYEHIREILFHEIDASLTLAQAAIADTGTLLVIPDQHEPRMMSLVPPLHVIKLSAKDIYPDFTSLSTYLSREKQACMPSNMILISSPSKTADIQQTLAYGAHGPREVIVLLEC